MGSTHRFPVDLARAVRSELVRRKQSTLRVDVLANLFETLYFSSLKTEEAQPITCYVAYIDPMNPDPDPPSNPPLDRWMVVPLGEPIPLNTSNLVKLAKATDPRTSSFAVYLGADERLCVWGLLDQGSQHHDFINYDVESGSAPPGLFQASIVGVGHLVAFIGFERIAELNIDVLLESPLDVFTIGPIRTAIDAGIHAYIKSVREALPDHIDYEERDHWNESLASNWTSSMCRLLRRARDFQHGGAILITPDASLSGLNVKYRIHYPRLRTALETYASAEIQTTQASDYITTGLDDDVEEIPADLYVDEFLNSNDLKQSRSALNGAIWFISLLTRVDGLVLMNSSLEVLGFGVEIMHNEIPRGVLRANDPKAVQSQELDYNHYGTRHRSMMRYCSQTPGSVGFVISQDGSVRAMTLIDANVVVWENIQLQLDLGGRRRRRRTPRTQISTPSA